MKTILLAAVVSSSISPTASAINVQNELNNYSNSLNNSNYFIESNSQTFQKIVNNKEKLWRKTYFWGIYDTITLYIKIWYQMKNKML